MDSINNISEEISDCEEVAAIMNQISTKYLPLITVMINKVKGTSIEQKWITLRNSILSPKNKLTVEKCLGIEKMLQALQNLKTFTAEEENQKTNFDQQLHSYEVEGISKKNYQIKDLVAASFDQSQVETQLTFLNDLACYHAYASSQVSRHSFESSASSVNSHDGKEHLVIDESAFFEVEKSVEESEEIDSKAVKIDLNFASLEKIEEIKKVEDVKSSEKLKIVKTEFKPCESRKVKSVSNELSRLIDNNSALASGRRTAFVKRISVGYKELDSPKLEGKRPRTEVSTPKTAVKKQRNSIKTESLEQQISSSKVYEDSENEDFKGWDSSILNISAAAFSPKVYITRLPSKISPPSDLKLWIYKSICNIAFAKSRRGFIFKCLIQGCRFQTLLKKTFMTHLKARHMQQEWSGFCNICTEIVSCGEGTIVGEFDHMNKVHVEPMDPDADPLQLEIVKIVPPESAEIIPIKNFTAKHFGAPKNTSKSPATFKTPPVIEKSAEKPQKLPTPTRKSSINAEKSLRPWLKTENAKQKPADEIKTMQSKEALCATYKCMSSTCSFFTIDANIFQKHLTFHGIFTSYDKANFLACGYCEFVGSSNNSLVSHIDSFHAYDRFQCNYCFYRSCTDFNVLTHQIMLHKGVENVILECPEVKQRDASAELDKVKKNREVNVPAIICVFCRGIFYTKKAFSDHVSKHSDKMRAKCLTCAEVTSKKTIANHLEKCHKIGLYQCVYCVMGTDTFETLNNHIANDHPSKMPVFCERDEHRNSDGTLKFPSPSVIETTCLKNINQHVSQNYLFKAPSDQNVLKNMENVGKIRKDLNFYKNEVSPSNQQVLPPIENGGKIRKDLKSHKNEVSPSALTNQQVLLQIIHPIGEKKAKTRLKIQNVVSLSNF